MPRLGVDATPRSGYIGRGTAASGRWRARALGHDNCAAGTVRHQVRYNLSGVAVWPREGA